MKSHEVTQVMMAEYATPGALMHAAEALRDAGYKDFDCHSPFPIHGMDQAMGLKRSPLGYIVFTVAVLGLVGIMSLMWWTSTTAYPLVISGKPLFSFQAFVPPAFAITILSAALTAVIGMLVLNRLPQLFHPLFYSERFSRVTDGGFYVSVESTDSKVDASRTSQLLESLGGTHVEVVKDA